MRKFSGFEKQPKLTARIVVVNYLIQLVAAVWLGYYLFTLPLTFLTVLIMAVIAIFIGTRLRGFNNIVHECSHFTFSEVREENVLLGSFCASIVLGCYRDYRDEHLSHHMHLGDYEKDLDLQGIEDLHLEEKLSVKTIFRHIVTPFIGRHLPYYLGANLSNKDGDGFRLMKLSLIALGIIILIVNPLPALFFVWFPYIWVYSSINYWTDCMDHGGILGADDELEASRNMLAPRPLRLLFFPRNDCYHKVHHLFPQIPVQHYEKCHNELLSHPDYVPVAKPKRKLQGFAVKPSASPAQLS